MKNHRWSGMGFPGASWRPVVLVLAVWTWPVLAESFDPADPGCRDALRRETVRQREPFWQEIAAAEPSGGTGCRSILGYALALCEARQHPERLARLLELAARMQDRDRQSRTFGNLKWYWRDEGVTDQNAVEFSMHDVSLMWLRHRDWIPEPARGQLRELMEFGAEGCLRHRVNTSYTNIAIKNAANLLVLGESLQRPEVAGEGRRRLDAVCVWTAENGTHEYCSPTYYFTDLNGLLLIATGARHQRQRQQAHALLELLWTDIALNWFPAAGRLGGTHSRSYDYLRGLGGLDWYTWLNGYFQKPEPGNAERVEPYWKEWAPPESLHQMSLERLPRLVRQSWGERPAESRTHALWPEVTLSSSGACYGSQDMALTVDLAGARDEPRCYFIPDGREDPYGKKRYQAGSHSKALHLTPFWAAAQRTCDAVGLAVYRDKDLAASQIVNLQSHFVLRRQSHGIWLDGNRIDVPQGSETSPGAVRVAVGKPLVLRYGTAGVAIRLLWATTRAGQPAAAALVDDGNQYGVLRLTVEHGLGKPAQGGKALLPQAGAAFWVRVGSGLATDAAFDAWRAKFQSEPPAAAEVSASGIRVAVRGVDGPVEILAEPPYDPESMVKLMPEPCRGVLEVDGKEIGRPILEAVEPLRSPPVKLEENALRKRIRENFFIPDPLPSLDPRTHHRFKPAEGVAAEAVTYSTEFGLRVPAILYLPDPLPKTASGKIPGFIVVNGHGGDKFSWYSYYAGALYAKAGVAVLTYDQTGEGERNRDRKSGTRAHDRIQGDEVLARRQAGLMITDVVQAVSYLGQRPEVDGKRIGAAGYSLGSFVLSLAGAVETRLRACVLVGGGNLDGPDEYWDSAKPMCQGFPYRSLGFLGDRGATIYALHASRGPTLIYNGLLDSVVAMDRHGEPFFKDLQHRVARLRGSAEGVFETGFDSKGSHRPYFLTRPVALWLEEQLDLPNWTERSIRAMPETVIGSWAAKNGVPMDRLYATEDREGGMHALGADVPGYSRDELSVFSAEEWERQKKELILESWLEAAGRK